MTLPTITDAPDPPLVTDPPAVFNAKAFALIAWLAGLPDQLNALSEAYGSYLGGLFTGTSTSSVAIGTGAKTFATQAGLAWGPGTALRVASDAAPATNYMDAVVTDYDAATGALTVDVAVVGGSGTHADWTISQRVAATGALIAIASSAAGAGLRVTVGTAPSSPTDGDVWITSTGIFTRVGGATLQLVSRAGIETLTNKTFAAPVITGYTETVSDPAAASTFAPDLSAATVFNYDTSANATLTLPTAAAGQSFAVRITYGGTHSVTLAGETVEWADGEAPDFTSTTGAVDVVSFVCFEAGIWTGFVGGLAFA